MTDQELVRELEACTLPEEQFHHVNHVRAAWVYLRYLPTLEAMTKFSKSLLNYATHLGKPDRYHETITWAYLLLLNERMHQADSPIDWDAFAAIHSDLLDWNRSILLSYYRDETLRSEQARRAFVMPDRLIASPPK